STCACVSTPSAMTSSPRLWAITINERTIAAASVPSMILRTKLRSIFNPRERKPGQITERRIAGAEIVESNSHAPVVQLLQVLGGVAIVERAVLGDFKLDAFRRQFGLAQRVVDMRTSPWNWGGNTLMPMRPGDSPIARQAAAFWQAVRMIHLPTS